MSDVEHKIDGLEHRMSGLEQRVSAVEKNLLALDLHVSAMDQNVAALEQHVSKVDQHVIHIDLTLENETNRNIKQISEGHSILYDKLLEALQFEKRDEMTQIRLNVVESDIIKIICHTHMA